MGQKTKCTKIRISLPTPELDHIDYCIPRSVLKTVNKTNETQGEKINNSKTIFFL